MVTGSFLEDVQFHPYGAEVAFGAEDQVHSAVLYSALGECHGLSWGYTNPNSQEGGSWSPVYANTGFSHSETAVEAELLAHALSFPEIHLKIFPLFHFGQTNFLRCCFLLHLFFIEMYPFSNRCMVHVCSNYRRCCPFHLCLCNPVWHHVIKVYVLCSLSSLLISLAFSLAIQNQYYCSSLNKKWSVEQGPNVHTDNLQQLDAELTNYHPTGW